MEAKIKSKEEKEAIRLARIEKQKAEHLKMVSDIKYKKDIIRNTTGKRINVHGKIHIIVPAIDRPYNMLANDMGHNNYALSKIE